MYEHEDSVDMSAPRLYEDWTGNVVNGADVRNLDPGAVRAARASFSERFPDRADESREWDDATFLSRAGMFKRGKVTNAALIILGKSGDRLLPPGVCIRWRLVDTDGMTVDTRTFDGPMLLTSTQAVSMVRNWSCRTGSGASESVVSAYRTSTLLEAVRNAIVHQDYGLGGTVEVVERENESVTVVSMGAFPDRAPESFVKGPPMSAPPRNPFLYNAMAGIGMIPASGSGIRSMFLSQAYRRFPMPDFDILGDRVAVRFSGLRGGSYARVLDLRDDLDIRTVMDLDRLAKNRHLPDRRVKSLVRRGLVDMIGDLPCIASGAGQEVASAYTAGTPQDAVLDLIRSKGFVTRSDVVEVLASRDSKDLTDEQLRVKATNLLQTMRKSGLVEKAEGSTRSARYVLTGDDGPSANRFIPRGRCPVMNTKQEILDALDGRGSSDLPPPAVFTQTGTIGQMDACGSSWPEANFDPNRMADLALQMSRMFGFATVRVPFDLTAEAGTLGADVFPGRRDSQPSVRGSPYRATGFELGQPPEGMMSPDEFVSTGRCAMIADVVDRMSREHEDLFITAGMVDPAGIAGHLVGMENLMMGYMMEPEMARSWVDAMVPYSCAYAERLSEHADNILIIGSASMDVNTVEMYGDLTERQLSRVLSSVSCFSTVHSCGRTLEVADSLARIGADGLSLEASADPVAYLERVAGRCRMFGSVNPIRTILMGTPDDVRSEARTYAGLGFDVITPECGVPPRSPDGNLYALAHYRD